MAKKYCTMTASEFNFQKVLKKTSFVTMTIPAWFVNKYGDKFSGTSKLGYDGRNPDWEVKVKVNIVGPAQYVHVLFASGFRKFCTMYQLKEGDGIKFDIVRKDCFNVTRVEDGASTSTAQENEPARNSS